MATLAESFLADLEDLSDDEGKSENEDKMDEDELDKVGASCGNQPSNSS